MTKTYRVADHLFAICPDGALGVFRRMEHCYAPFEAEPREGEPLRFCLTLTDEVGGEGFRLVYEQERQMAGVTRFIVRQNEAGELLLDIHSPWNDELTGRLRVSDDLTQASLQLMGPEPERAMCFTNGVMIAYLLSVTSHNTLLTHASAILYEGRAYLFLGKSGTGKSTHTRLWRENISGAELLNDDHPILRADNEGCVTAYGSPWSGKTPCYRNLSAPLQALVHLRQAPYNKIERIGGIASYAQLMSSCSTMKWFKNLGDAHHATLVSILSPAVGSYVMDCLPDGDAARLSCETTRPH